MTRNEESLQEAFRRFAKNAYYGINSVAGIGLGIILAMQAAQQGSTIFAIPIAAVSYIALIGYGYVVVDKMKEEKRRGKAGGAKA